MHAPALINLENIIMGMYQEKPLPTGRYAMALKRAKHVVFPI
jgi:hypothetical protein